MATKSFYPSNIAVGEEVRILLQTNDPKKFVNDGQKGEYTTFSWYCKVYDAENIPMVNTDGDAFQYLSLYESQSLMIESAELGKGDGFRIRRVQEGNKGLRFERKDGEDWVEMFVKQPSSQRGKFPNNPPKQPRVERESEASIGLAMQYAGEIAVLAASRGGFEAEGEDRRSLFIALTRMSPRQIKNEYDGYVLKGKDEEDPTAPDEPENTKSEDGLPF